MAKRRETPAKSVELKGVGVLYRLLTERQTTIKGRLLGMFSGRGAKAEEFWALRNIDLEVRRGEVLGVIGPNGSGKSTLLRVIANVIEPTEGSVTIQGDVRPLLDLSGAFDAQQSGRNNAYLYGALHRITRDEMDEHIPKIAEFAQIGAFFDAPVKTYSSGMLARLSFALATQLRPDILLVDEVLSVGDERFQQKSYFRMQRLIEKGSLVVIVSHNLAFLRQTCSRVIYLADNQIIGEGAPAEVIARYLSHCR